MSVYILYYIKYFFHNSERVFLIDVRIDDIKFRNKILEIANVFIAVERRI